MNVRVRAVGILLASGILGVGAFWVWARTGGSALAYLMLVPLGLGMLGLLELVTGVPIDRLDEGWQRLAVYVKIPVALVGGILVLWAFLWIVAKGLGA